MSQTIIMLLLRHMNYTKEGVVSAIESFIKKNGREPEGSDFCNKNDLPNRRTIERRFGGLVSLRKELGLYSDHRTGKKRRDVANKINQRAMKLTTDFYKTLRTFFDEPFIHRESSIFDDRRNRTDFKVYAKKTFLVDIFYPKNRHSLVGCVGIKSKKYPISLRDFMGDNFDKVIFVNLNESVPNNIKVNKDFCLMSPKEFWDYCQTML